MCSCEGTKKPRQKGRFIDRKEGKVSQFCVTAQASKLQLTAFKGLTEPHPQLMSPFFPFKKNFMCFLQNKGQPFLSLFVLPSLFAVSFPSNNI